MLCVGFTSGDVTKTDEDYADNFSENSFPIVHL